MKVFEGKTPTERNKIIAAAVLGVMGLIAMTYTLSGFFISPKKTINVSISPTPTVSPRNGDFVKMPSNAEMNLAYTTTPVVYNPNSFYAPDAGRNIFAFYEPPVPTPYSPTPLPPPAPLPPPETPAPTPTPPFLVGYVTPQSVYAGQKTFRLEVNGDKFTPDAQIFLNGSPLPTTFISPQRLVADVPSNFIQGAGSLIIMVRTPDNNFYSNQVAINVQAPPIPQMQYIGMIARKRNNNDTAYFQDQGKPTPISARLNDVINGFRLISISAQETIFEDVNLGFKHKLPLSRPTNNQTSGTNPPVDPSRNPPNKFNNPSVLNSPNFPNPNNPNQPVYTQPGEIPGIPGNIQIYVPPTPPPPKKDENDDDDGGG